jgi:2-dehydropantoate 2-reductase
MARRADADLKIVIVGAGAIGASVGGWLAPKHRNTWFLDRRPIAETLRREGITLYHGDDRDGTRLTIPVRVIDDISEVEDADVVLIAVKNYSLDAVAASIRQALGDRPLVIGFQNGRDNQSILPRHFSRCAYCVVSYNAWVDEPVTVGYQKRGPLILGTPQNDLGAELEQIKRVLGKGVETVVTHHLQDAVHSKIAINLTNSLTTLIGHRMQPISDKALFQTLLTQQVWEGVRVLKANGFRECRLGGIPSWSKLWASAHLPRFLTQGMFNRNIKKMVLSSMAQDVIQRGAGNSELDSINGYILSLADKAGIAVPYNRNIYELCIERFARQPFEPMDVKEVWQHMQAKP